MTVISVWLKILKTHVMEAFSSCTRQVRRECVTEEILLRTDGGEKNNGKVQLMSEFCFNNDTASDQSEAHLIRGGRWAGRCDRSAHDLYLKLADCFLAERGVTGRQEQTGPWRGNPSQDNCFW